mmetsp:Transcript_24106/g.38596  ORF Transcript_24106/g.38596 Transcript_24106/m.38596 type:complete len:213 (+) Transcript_24106:1165-1803(+)
MAILCVLKLLCMTVCVNFLFGRVMPCREDRMLQTLGLAVVPFKDGLVNAGSHPLSVLLLSHMLSPGSKAHVQGALCLPPSPLLQQQVVLVLHALFVGCSLVRSSSKVLLKGPPVMSKVCLPLILIVGELVLVAPPNSPKSGFAAPSVESASEEASPHDERVLEALHDRFRGVEHLGDSHSASAREHVLPKVAAHSCPCRRLILESFHYTLPS